MPWVENEDLERERRGGHCEVDKGDSASDEHVLLQQDEVTSTDKAANGLKPRWILLPVFAKKAAVAAAASLNGLM